jgi:hypothetical protein
MTEPKQDSETLKLMYDLARKGLDDQLTAARDADVKIFQTFTAACVLIGLATLRGIKLHGHHHAGLVLVSFAVLAFVCNAGVAINALWSRNYRVPIATSKVVANYWFDPPNVLMDAYVHDASEAYDENERHHKDKHRALRQCLVALLIEAAAIGASLIATNL